MKRVTTIERRTGERGETLLFINGAKEENATDRSIIKNTKKIGEYIKNVRILEYSFDKRVFEVEYTKEWGERHPNFY